MEPEIGAGKNWDGSEIFRKGKHSGIHFLMMVCFS